MSAELTAADSMRIAMIGTRGVPARYGGFETAIEEIGRRLVDRGHEVVVYCRGGVEPGRQRYLGMELVHLPAAPRKSLETLSHTFLSVGHLLRQRPLPDAAIMFNAANAPFVPLLHVRRIPVAIHVDGLEWRRTKWQGAGRRYYRAVESMSVRWGDALIADATGISDYYTEEFGVPTDLLSYGAPVQDAPRTDRIAEIGLQPADYHLVVARFEPENHVLEIVEGYAASSAARPLVVVGSAPYSDSYKAAIAEIANADPRIELLGGIWDAELLDELYANAFTYIHGHSVGGTNPSLLRAMGAGTAVLAYDVNFNREVLGGIGTFFSDAAGLASILSRAEAHPQETRVEGDRLRERARSNYRWDDVTVGYESLLRRLQAGYSQRGTVSGRRRGVERKVGIGDKDVAQASG